MAVTLTWIDPVGTAVPLMALPDRGVLYPGAQGLEYPPLQVIDDVVPLQPGGRLRSTRWQTRAIDLPMFLQADSALLLRVALRQFLGWFSPERGYSTLRALAEDGTTRDLRNVKCIAGLEGLNLSTEDTVTSRSLVLTLRAWDPFWYQLPAVQATYTSGTPAPFFPFFPLRFADINLFAGPAITNLGDIEAWPVFTITGPGAGITLTNLTTSKTLRLGIALGTGETLTIDTQPDAKTILDNHGINRFNTMLEDNSVLWALDTGPNLMEFGMGQTDVTSSITVTFRQRYFTP